MRLPRLRRAAPSPDERPRRRAPRVDGPRSIVWDGDVMDAESRGAPLPFELRVDAARERLRRAIPPVADEE